MATPPTSWLLLILSLPNHSASARMRIWRRLKLLGCGALRDGAYLLPGAGTHQQVLRELADDTTREGGSAWLLTVDPTSDAEQLAFLALFDRAPEQAALLATLAEAQAGLGNMSLPDINRLLRKLRREIDTLGAIDYFPGESAGQLDAAWRAFQRAAESHTSPGEPQQDGPPIVLRDIADYQRRSWATRHHLWVDRVASAWLIRRFIDPAARFVWLASIDDCPADALGFDFDGAAFSHSGQLVTFEVLLASFGLQTDPGLHRLAALVHALDLDKGFVPEAAGFEAMLSGARERNPDDDMLLADMRAVLDSLYTHFSHLAAPTS
jgi:hypothetical protein